MNFHLFYDIFPFFHTQLNINFFSLHTHKVPHVFDFPFFDHAKKKQNQTNKFPQEKTQIFFFFFATSLKDEELCYSNTSDNKRKEKKT